MGMYQAVFVRCSFRRGGFPGDRVFMIEFDNGATLRGVAQVPYCYRPDRQPLGEGPPPGEVVEGLVLGIEVAGLADGTTRVQLPDGDIYDVDDGQIEPAVLSPSPSSSLNL